MKVVEIAKLVDKLDYALSDVEEAITLKGQYYIFVRTELSKRINLFNPENIEYSIFCKMCEMYNNLIEEHPPCDYGEILDAIDFIDRYIEKMYSETLVLTDGIED